jgi:hypothetical protein
VRTTITLEADTEAAVRRLMRERGLTFKQAVNEAIRAGTAPGDRSQYIVPTFNMGVPRIDITKALRLAAELEDEEIIRKLDAGR